MKCNGSLEALTFGVRPRVGQRKVLAGARLELDIDRRAAGIDDLPDLQREVAAFVRHLEERAEAEGLRSKVDVLEMRG